VIPSLFEIRQTPIFFSLKLWFWHTKLLHLMNTLKTQKSWQFLIAKNMHKGLLIVTITCGEIVWLLHMLSLILDKKWRKILMSKISFRKVILRENVEKLPLLVGLNNSLILYTGRLIKLKKSMMKLWVNFSTVCENLRRSFHDLSTPCEERVCLILYTESHPGWVEIIGLIVGKWVVWE